MAVHGVIVALTGDLEARACAELDQAPELSVVSRCADLVEAEAAAQSGLGSVVVVMEQPSLTRSVVQAMAGCVVVAVAADRDGAARLQALGIAHVLTTTDPGPLVEGVLAAVSQPAVRSSPQVARPADAGRGRMMAVWGPTGAPGRTTVAVNVGAELAARGLETLVIDADTYGGAVAQACGLLDEAPGLVAVARACAAGTAEPALIDMHAHRVGPGLRVLAGISRPQRWPEVPGVALDVVWELARRCADVVVVDAGFGLDQDEELTFDTRAPQRHGATLSALAAADTVVAVGSAEPVSVQRLIQGLETLRQVVPHDPVVVVNRVRPEVAGPQPEQTLADALVRYAGVSEAFMLPWDPRSADAATLSGQTLAERVPRSRLRKAVAGVAAALDEGLPAPARNTSMAAPLLTH